jgi:tetratricopeptide (TPR) repeat protein
MARRITRQELKRDEVADAAVDVGHWIEDHWRSVATWAGAAVLLALAAGGWVWWSRHNERVIEEQLAEELVKFSQVQQAGFADRAAVDAVLSSLTEVSERAGMSPPGLVARVCRGSALLHTDRADQASTVLEEVVRNAERTLIGPANGLLASAYQAQGRTDEAIELLRGLLEAKDPAVPLDQTLLQLGMLFETAGRDEEAREHYQRIVDEHPTGSAAAAARRELAS